MLYYFYMKETQNVETPKQAPARNHSREEIVDIQELYRDCQKLFKPYLKRMRLFKDDWSRYELVLKYPVSINGKMKNNVSFVNIIKHKTYLIINIPAAGDDSNIKTPSILEPLQIGKAGFKLTSKPKGEIKLALRAILNEAYAQLIERGWVAK
jgi:hypothetical protein